MRFFAATHKIQRLQARLAGLVALVLVTHSLDVCAAHTGIPDLSPVTSNFSVTHGNVKCSAPPGVACLCAECVCVPFPLDEQHGDGCSTTSELATRAQSISYHFAAPQIIVTFVAAMPDKFVIPAPLAAFLGGNGPPIAKLCTQFYLSSLSGRAPPVTA